MDPYLRERGSNWSTWRKPPDNQSENWYTMYASEEKIHRPNSPLKSVPSLLGQNVLALSSWATVQRCPSDVSNSGQVHVEHSFARNSVDSSLTENDFVFILLIQNP